MAAHSPRARRSPWTLAIVGMVAAALADVRTAQAQPFPVATPRAHWRPAYRRVGAADYVWGGVTVTGLVLEVGLLQPHPPPVRFNGPILFDTAVRDALRYRSPAVRDDASLFGWIGLVGLLAYPVAVDIPVAWARGGAALAWQFFIQDTIVLSTAAAVDLAIRDTVGRARPETTDCLARPGSDCQSSEASRSFPGGHMAVSTAAAALICTQHMYTRLYGGIGDALTCGVGIALDVTVGISRIVADVHWTSDIIAGSLLGGLVGWGVPTLMWYGFGRGSPFGLRPRATTTTTTTTATAPQAMVAPMPMVYPGGGGLAAVGMF